MFDFVRKHNRLFQFLLLILILPSFVLFGVQGYSRMMDESNSAVATVAGQKITRAEWDFAHRQQAERMRQQMPTIDPKLLDSPESRQQTLDELVRERVLQAALLQQHLGVSKERLNKVFWNDPQFAMLRTPDGKGINEVMLAAQGMSFDSFAQRLRQDLSLRMVTEGVTGSAVGTAALAELNFDAFFQQREVQLQRFSAQDFAAKVNPSESELEAFYKDPANAARFQLPETATVEYLVLDLDALKAGVSFTDKELHDYYEQNQSRYGVPEERRASHILIKADKKAPESDRAKARARAESLLAEVRKNPAGFADLAKKNSQDEGSATRGGDLDFVARGAFVKPFEDKLFTMKQGEISDLVESDYGFHIIQLTGVRGGTVKSFDSVHAEIEDEVRKQLALKRYSELAEQFSNTVYEQSDSLKPAADKFKLPLRTATLQRKADPTAQGVLASPKFLDAVFGNDALHNKRNTEAVEIGPNQLAAAHVTDYKPTRMPAMADVLPKLRELLVQKQAAALAVKAGQERLAALKASGAVGGMEAAEVVSRVQPGKLSRKALAEVMRADTGKLPSFVGVDDSAEDGSYLVVAISKLLPRDAKFADAKRSQDQYAQAFAAAESDAYFKALKTQLKVTIKANAASTAASAASAP